MATLTVGSTIRTRGYVSKALYLRGQTSSELERRLGYRSGRLGHGWHLLFLLQKPRLDEFDLRGYSHLSDGIPRGGHHPPEAELENEGWTEADINRLKRGVVERTFKIAGPERLVKVVPVIEHSDAETYPPGSGIPQWRLSAELPFRVQAFIGPGDVYRGGYGD